MCEPVIGFNRMKELMQISAKTAQDLKEKGVLSHELCIVGEAVRGFYNIDMVEKCKTK